MVYVDDLLLASSNMSEIMQLKEQFNHRLEMNDLGEARMCLGLEIRRNREAHTRVGQRRRPPADTAGHCRGCGSGIREAGLVDRRRLRVSSQFSFSRQHDRFHSLPPPSAWSVKVKYCTSVEVRVAR